MSQILVHIFKHHLWANSELLEVCDGMSDGVLDATVNGTYGSVRDTFVHLFAAEERYLARISEYAPGEPLVEGTFPGFRVLRERGHASAEGLLALAQSESGERVISGIHPRYGKFAIPVSTFLAQAINHATEHRAHVCTILTQQGIEPPVLDVWTYEESVAGGGS
jgi:uncharacterized damage-inducible protein DinB